MEMISLYIFYAILLGLIVVESMILGIKLYERMNAKNKTILWSRVILAIGIALIIDFILSMLGI